jgi:hypothetical protein
LNARGPQVQAEQPTPVLDAPILFSPVPFLTCSTTHTHLHRRCGAPFTVIIVRESSALANRSARDDRASAESHIPDGVLCRPLRRGSLPAKDDSETNRACRKRAGARIGDRFGLDWNQQVGGDANGGTIRTRASVFSTAAVRDHWETGAKTLAREEPSAARSNSPPRGMAVESGNA